MLKLTLIICSILSLVVSLFVENSMLVSWLVSSTIGNLLMVIILIHHDIKHISDKLSFCLNKLWLYWWLFKKRLLIKFCYYAYFNNTTKEKDLVAEVLPITFILNAFYFVETKEGTSFWYDVQRKWEDEIAKRRYTK